MSHRDEGQTHATDQGEEERREIAAVQDELDERAEGDGLAAEADAGETTGLSEG